MTEPIRPDDLAALVLMEWRRRALVIDTSQGPKFVNMRGAVAEAAEIAAAVAVERRVQLAPEVVQRDEIRLALRSGRTLVFHVERGRQPLVPTTSREEAAALVAMHWDGNAGDWPMLAKHWSEYGRAYRERAMERTVGYPADQIAIEEAVDVLGWYDGEWGERPERAGVSAG